MTSDLWRRTGAIWPIGVSCSLTWYDLGAIAHILQTHHIRLVVEIGVEHGGLASYLEGYCHYTGCAYKGIDITLNALNTTVRDEMAGGQIEQHDAWAAPTIARVGRWMAEHPSPALIIIDGGDKPKELHLYAPLLRDGDVMVGHDYHNEYSDAEIASVPAIQVRADWLDDTLLCMWIKR